ncbi:hypothetical protein KCU91_g141, partial [Aureobasidium melanogenum]
MSRNKDRLGWTQKHDIQIPKPTEMCGHTVMVYECTCGKSSREIMPLRVCRPVCEIEKDQLTIRLTRPCEECSAANINMLTELRRNFAEGSATALHDKPLPGIPAPGSIEGLPPSYQQATEKPPTYARTITEEEPASYDNVITAIAAFQPDDLVAAWHTFRASQLSLLTPLISELETLNRQVSKTKRRLHRAEDVGFCEEVIPTARYQALAKEATKLGDYNQARLHIKAASEHADKLLEMKIELSRPEQQPRRLAGQTRQQLHLLEKIVQTLEARTTSRIWALVTRHSL